MLEAHVVIPLDCPPEYVSRKKEECVDILKDEIFKLVQDGGNFYFGRYTEKGTTVEGNIMFSVYLSYERTYYRVD